MWFDDGNVCIGDARGTACFPWPTASIYVGSAALVLALVLGVLVWDARRTPTPSETAARANRHATLASVVGVAMLIVVLMWMTAPFLVGIPAPGGRVLATLPAVAGACLLGAQTLGQLTWPRPTGSHREAELVRRAITDVTPLSQRRLVLAWAGAALVLLAAFGVVADGPRSLTRVAGPHTETISPYPGSYYGVPMGLAIIALVVATELVLRLITVRPAVDGVSVEWDLHLRRRSAGHVTRGVQAVLSITVAGILVAAGWGHLALGRGSPLAGPGEVGSDGSVAQQYLGSGLLIGALVVLLTGLAATVLPLRRGRRRAMVAPGAPVAS